MEYRLDDVDRRVIYALMTDSRNTSAPDIAAAADVSPATVRNRIGRLEEAGVITGYHADIDFEAADGRLRNLYLCNAPVAEREKLAAKVRAVPGVVNVRELMTGRRNLHVMAVGERTVDLRRIARAISGIGVEIEDEDLVQTETHHPYSPFRPEEEREGSISDFVSLSGGSEVAEMTVGRDAPIADMTLAEASERRVIGEDALVIAIERDDAVRTAHGDTTVEPDDVVTVFSRGGVDEATIDAFRGDGGT
ncbi:winged helix-turn-helix transcriptional regulator [Halorubrum sp. JWXQ-INN 858]|uniref:winged helix-turn-helix transcriptional regulator n=1 Tax=Halorubrum sp. JWXQ-INN 858 TaxID=2690782 RepID=UPI001357F325|nr:Lrp/AsnC family transcriptional regulator [Halorubrum sp. JWXQ-INN 858]MWV64173.1 winged helix-turn-helix transcriptional regulator [Halorubrum sp. JWXQ-INN 858]